MTKYSFFFFTVTWAMGLGPIPLVSTQMQGQTSIQALPDDPTATEEDRKFIRRAYEIARKAASSGDRPYGALLVHNGKIIAEDQNRVNQAGDVTKHAENGVVATASQKFSRELLSQSILYTSGEPCLMCLGAINWIRLSKVVYGSTSSQVGKAYGRPYRGIPIREVFQRINPNLTVVGPVLEEEGLKIHIDFSSK
jgi:tRNA(Arg) A34 adenosine deaminase TadA